MERYHKQRPKFGSLNRVVFTGLRRIYSCRGAVRSIVRLPGESSIVTGDTTRAGWEGGKRKEVTSGQCLRGRGGGEERWANTPYKRAKWEGGCSS